MLALLVLPSQALAQACCAGSSALTPARLGIHEDGAVGIILKGTGILGGWDGQGNYFVEPAGTGEFDAELDVVGTVRVFTDGQVSLLIPFLKTWREAPGISEWGGGIGDINLAGRYDFTHAGEFSVLPGIAVLVGVTFPSGRAPEFASNLLATDATGIGAFQLTGGVALEQSYGHFLLNLTGLVGWRTPRSVRGVDETLGVQFQGLAGIGYAFDNDASLALSFGYVAELDAVINGQKVPDSGRALPTLGFSGSLPLGESWRLQGGLNYNPPIPGLGKNQTAGLGFQLSILRTWT
ncbi:MAG: hypothetical protein ACLPJH_20000 [Myxococcaceae bacterium]